jgi:L-ribulose-5-phosphate 3-epimerase
MTKPSLTHLTSRVGVCSWSLDPKDPAELIAQLSNLGLTRVQLALSQAVQDPDTWGAAVDELRSAKIEVISGMFATIGEDYSTLESIQRTGGVVPDEHWENNLKLATGVAKITEREGIDLVMFHAGFVPHDKADPGYAKLTDRLTVLADLFADAGCELLLETGQESADELLAFLDSVNHPNLGINFDPANMILYGQGDPIDAISKLVDRTGQIHIKDAVAATTPGEWGTEVVVGQGQVDWDRFFMVLRDAGYDGDMVIEREAGEDRPSDIAAARDLLNNHLAGIGTPVTPR